MRQPEDTVELYKLVFDNEDGDKVLYDLGLRFCEQSSTFSTDPCETAYREGQRTVVLFIRSMLRDKPNEEDSVST